jgi:hypothetical protein
MKQVKRKITFNGLDINLDIDINKLVSDVKGKYKSEIDTLKKNVASRDKHILKLHKELKSKENMMYIFMMCCNIHEKVKDIYNINYNDYMILAFICDKDHIHKDKIKRYFACIGIKVTSYRINKMIELDYIRNSPKSEYIYITDIGKNIVSSIAGAMKQDYEYYNKNRPTKKSAISSIVNIEKSKYTEEERKSRSENYKIMMKPFWDSGYNMIPKDVGKRYDMLKSWIEVNPAERSHKIYDKFLKRWGAELQGVW